MVVHAHRIVYFDAYSVQVQFEQSHAEIRGKSVVLIKLFYLLLLALLWSDHNSLDPLLGNDMSDLTTLLYTLSPLNYYSLWLAWLCRSVLYVLSIYLSMQMRNRYIFEFLTVMGLT